MIALIVILSLMFVAYVTFAFRYFRYSPWRSTWQGVIMLAQKVTMAALVGFFIVDTLATDRWAGRFPLLMALLVLMLIEAWATLAGLLYVQRSTRPVTERQGAGLVPEEDIEEEAEGPIDTLGGDNR